MTVDEVRSTLTSGILSKQVTEVQLHHARATGDEPFAVMRFDALHEALHFAAHGGGIRPQAACRGTRVPFDIQHGRQTVRFAWHIPDEPVRLFVCRGTEIIEMVGRMRNAGGTSALPVFVEARIQPVTAFRRLDEDEGNARLLDLPPVDVAVPLGHVDAVHFVAMRCLAIEMLGICVVEARGDGGGLHQVVGPRSAGRDSHAEGKKK